MMFFDPDTWPAKEIAFPDDDDGGDGGDGGGGGGGLGGVWVQGQKLSEKSRQKSLEDSKASMRPSSASAVFSCYRKDDSKREKYAMKVYMQ